MGTVETGRRHLVRGGLLTSIPVAFSAPAAAQQQTVAGLSQGQQAGAFALFSLVVCFIMLVSLEHYTERTSDVIHERPVTAFLGGILISMVSLVPYLLLAALSFILGSLNAVTLALLTVLATPLIGILVPAFGIGLVAIGRLASENLIAILLIVLVISAAIGAFPVPLAVGGLLIALFGLGAMYRDMRYGKSKLETEEKESFSQQHRYM